MTELQVAWDAAVANCLDGHDTCSYGGMTPRTGYWLRDEACDLPHGDQCAWCGSEAETAFVGWATSGQEVYQVPACQPCADQWVAEHPEWKRRGPAADSRPAEELLANIEADYQQKLADMDPVMRAVWQEADRIMENMLLWGSANGPAPDEQPTFAGIESIFGLDNAPKLVAPGRPKPAGPPRQRYNPTTRKWEVARER